MPALCDSEVTSLIRQQTLRETVFLTRPDPHARSVMNELQIITTNVLYHKKPLFSANLSSSKGGGTNAFHSFIYLHLRGTRRLHAMRFCSQSVMYLISGVPCGNASIRSAVLFDSPRPAKLPRVGKQLCEETGCAFNAQLRRLLCRSICRRLTQLRDRNRCGGRDRHKSENGAVIRLGPEKENRRLVSSVPDAMPRPSRRRSPPPATGRSAQRLDGGGTGNED